MPTPQETAQNIGDITDMLVNQALQTAEQVQAGAQRIQAQSETTPPSDPVQVTTNPSGPFTPGGLFMFGFGALTALGIGYYLVKRGR